MDITEHADTVQTLRVAKAEIAKWTEVKVAAEEKLKEALGDAPEGTIDGHKVISYETHTRTDFDSKTMRAEIPEPLWRKYVRSTVIRPFKLVD